MFDKASELYNKLLETYFHKSHDLSDAERKKMGKKIINPKSYSLKHIITGLNIKYRLINKDL